MEGGRKRIPLALRRKQKKKELENKESRHSIIKKDTKTLTQQSKKREDEYERAIEKLQMGGMTNNMDVLEDIEDEEFIRKVEYLEREAGKSVFHCHTAEEIERLYEIEKLRVEMRKPEGRKGKVDEEENTDGEEITESENEEDYYYDDNEEDDDMTPKNGKKNHLND